MNEDTNTVEKSLSLYQTYLNLKVDYHTKMKWFIRGPKHHKEYQMLSLEHSCSLYLI